MSGNYTKGICFDNRDPENHGRIRVVDYNTYKNYLSVNQIQDSVANANEGETKYTPWAYVTDNTLLSDRYVATPFLPSNLNIIPSNGQLVRLLKDDDGTILYVGPITDNPIYLTSNYREERNKQKSETPKEIANKTSDTGISGFNNEQLLLGNNRALIRLDYINNKTSKTQYPIIQLSKYKKSLTYKETTKTITKVKDVFLDYIIELTFNYKRKNDFSDKNIQCVVAIYDTLEVVQDDKGKSGLNKNNYSKYTDYTSGSLNNQYTVRHVLDFNSVEAMDNNIEAILSAYGQKKIKFFNPDTPNSNNYTEPAGNVSLVNKVTATPNNGGAVNDTPDMVVNLNNSVVRVSTNTRDRYMTPTVQLQDELFIPRLQPNDTLSLDYIRFKEFNSFIGKVRKYSEDRYLGNQNLQQPITETIKSVNESSEDKDVTAHVVYADKFLMLSSINSPNYLDNTNSGMDNQTVAKFISSLSSDGNRSYDTYGWVRGEKILEVINRLISIVLTHGHSIGQVDNSINNDARKLLTDLVGELTQEINGNKLNQPTSIINHNFRIN